MANLDDRHVFALDVVRKLKRAGYQALWAGGCVRDMLMGHAPTDYDVATDADPDRVMSLFPRTVPVGMSFGVVRVLGPKSAGEVEVATFRSDGRYVDGRRPESVSFGSPREDAARRDFTINGMFLDPLSNEVFDYVGGRQDLEAGVVRAIGDPTARFAEDKLRLIRAARFSARFQFIIEGQTAAALQQMAGEIRVVAAERVAQELKRMLVHPTRSAGMTLLLRLGLLDAILPQLTPLTRLRAETHADSFWDESLRVLAHLPEEPSFPLAFAALLQNVGKPVTAVMENDRPAYNAHERTARQIADEVCRHLKLSNTDRELVDFLVEHQCSLAHPQQLSRARLKTILAMPAIDELLDLHRAIALARGGDTRHVEYCHWYITALPDGEINPAPLISGHDLAALGLAPGPAYSQWLARVREAQLDGVLKTREQAVAFVQARHAVEGAD
jgi:poly(A) polymerase